MTISPRLLVGYLFASQAAFAASIEVNPGEDIIALTASLSPGTEIVFNDGAYQIESPLDWTGIGTADQPIVLRAASGAHPVIQLNSSWTVARLHDAQYVEITGLTFSGTQAYFDGDGGYDGMHIDNCSHVTFENNVVKTISRNALVMGGNNVDITVTHNEITGTEDGTGIYVGCGDASCWTQDSTVSGNWVHDLGGQYAYGILFEAGTQNVVIEDNVIHNVAARGLQVESTEFGDPNTVNGNAIWAIGLVDVNTDGVGLGVYGSAVVQNNLVFNILGRGLRLSSADGRAFENTAVSFNTIVGTSDWGIDLADFAGNPGMVLANNVVANPIGRGMRVGADDIDPQNRLISNVISGYVEGVDPLIYPGAILAGGGLQDFSDPDAFNFYPNSFSLLVDSADAAGESYVPAFDFNGYQRDGEFPDVGAYELVASENPGWVVAPGFKEVSEDGVVPGTELERGCCKKKDKGDSDEAVVVLLPLFAALARRRARKS